MCETRSLDFYQQSNKNVLTDLMELRTLKLYLFNILIAESDDWLNLNCVLQPVAVTGYLIIVIVCDLTVPHLFKCAHNVIRISPTFLLLCGDYRYHMNIISEIIL